MTGLDAAHFFKTEQTVNRIPCCPNLSLNVLCSRCRLNCKCLFIWTRVKLQNFKLKLTLKIRCWTWYTCPLLQPLNGSQSPPAEEDHMTAVSHGLASSRSKSLDHNNREDAHMLDTGKYYIIQARRYNFKVNWVKGLNFTLRFCVQMINFLAINFFQYLLKNKQKNHLKLSK